MSLSSVYMCCCLDQVGCEPVISSSLEPEVVAVVEVLATQHEMTVEDLQSGRLYTCSVAASSLKGYGPSASMTVWTKPLGESPLQVGPSVGKTGEGHKGKVQVVWEDRGGRQSEHAGQYVCGG